jgi:hypothetical protein
MQPKPVRTYLDPDAVGPLPRAVIADDSDALAAARTMVRLPDSPTQEIYSDDVLEVMDPSRRPSSLSPVGYDSPELLLFLPRRRLGRYVAAALAVSGVLILAAIIRSVASSGGPPAHAVAAGPAPQPTVVAPAAIVAPPPTAEATTGTLRIDGSAEGQRVYLDGVALTASAAMLRCGPHVLAVGSLARARIVDVPCGGDITVFR